MDEENWQKESAKFRDDLLVSCSAFSKSVRKLQVVKVSMERGSSGGVKRERGQITVQGSSSQAYHEGSPVWVPEASESGFKKQKVGRWVKGVVLRGGVDPDGMFRVTVQTEEGNIGQYSPEDLPLQNERDDTVDDLVKSDFLHEPG